MKHMLRLVFWGVALLALVGPVWAQTAPTGTPKPGETSEALAKGLYCSTKALIEGDVGLVIGLVLVFIGIWSLVNKAKFLTALPFILMGALITAVPSLIESSFVGLGQLLKENNISKNTFDKPTCTATEELDKLYKDPQTGVYYPSRGNYNAPPVCTGGKLAGCDV